MSERSFEEAYRLAFLDWLACAARGWGEAAAAAARAADDSMPGRIVSLGTAGHVLDFDDTYAPGLAHCTAPVAPAALVLGADRGCSVGEVLAAYALGFEATAALARAGHPELYRRGWHPTAVCGVVGAAVASSVILHLDSERTASAVNIALLQAGGLRSAFGSDGKSLQVGMAAAGGARAALLAKARASAPDSVREGFEQAYAPASTISELVGSTDHLEVLTPSDDPPAIRENWIKAYPCCLQTHSSIEAADVARRRGVPAGELVVHVHPVSVQAAPHGVPMTPLQAKFSIPYTAAFALLHGQPTVEDFAALDGSALRLSARVEVRADPSLGESEAVLVSPHDEPIRVEFALGSPQRAMNEEQLAAKVRSLTSLPLLDLVREDAPAADLLGAIVSADG